MTGGLAAQAADGIDPAFQSARVSQKFGADLSAAAGRNVRSGDADLPVKAPLHERRARLDTVSPKLFSQHFKLILRISD